ncbi:MAG: hypothetical protein NZ654_07350, partial [Acidimicrobiales bacterium]|nr:hypothetical protein [Acidimicrobiales bacterium]
MADTEDGFVPEVVIPTVVDVVPQPDGTRLIIFDDGSTQVVGTPTDPADAEATLLTEIADAFPWAVELGFLDLIKDLVVDG